MEPSAIRAHIFVCTSSLPPEVAASCGLEGGKVLNALPFILAEQGLRGVRVTSCGCLGHCGGGASLVVYPEGVFYQGVTCEQLPELIQKHFVVRRPMAELVVAS